MKKINFSEYNKKKINSTSNEKVLMLREIPTLKFPDSRTHF